MSPNEISDAELGATLRAALASTEPAQTPEFSRVWSRSQRRAAAAAPARSHRTAPFLRPVLAVAVAGALAALGLLQWSHLLRERQRVQIADYAFAVQVAAANGFSVPTDKLLQGGPASLLRGAPAVPNIEYPLMPKESFL